MKFFISLSACLLISQTIFTQSHWEAIVVASDTWSYLPAISEPPSTWYQPGFDDSVWEVDTGGFGYDDGDDATITGNVNSIYIRKKFTILDTSIIRNLILDIDYDDAFVAYLNGIEIARSSNITDTIPKYNSTLSTDHEAKLYLGSLPERFFLQDSSLKQDENTFAIQVLNTGTSSSDMSSLIFLSAEINSSDTIYKPTPSWFTEPVSFEESNLPLILIDTKGNAILDEPKINALMKVINNLNGINNINDTVCEFSGNIAIEIRGTTSQWFDQKSYNFETQTDSGTNLNVSLIGMPEENDWVLHGPYTDKSLMRNVLAYHLGNLTGRWSPRTRFCEMYINGDYRGVYVLLEKIKRDKNRVNIASLNPDEISGDDLTGGYILKIDRPDAGYWVSPYRANSALQQIVPVSYVDPEYADLAAEQREYIKTFVTDFENALHSTDFADPVNGYRPYINLESFLDYYLVNELSRNLDAYRVSTYFYKDKDSNGGKLTMGPFWDYNLGFGNADFFSAGNTNGWVADGLGDGDAYAIPFWWEQFGKDPYFKANLKARWQELRSDKFSTANLNNFIDSCADLVAEAQVRQYQKYDILNTYVWPNKYIGGTYENEVNYFKNWVDERLLWMDSQINIITDLDQSYTNSLEISTYPNPFTESVTLRFNLLKTSKVDVFIQNILGEIVSGFSRECSEGMNEFVFESQQFNGANLYFYNLFVNGELVHTGKMIKK